MNKGIRRKVITGLLLCSFAIVLLGAGKISKEMESRKVATQRVKSEVSTWLHEMGSGVAATEREAWEQAVHHQPLTLLRACAIEEQPEGN